MQISFEEIKGLLKYISTPTGYTNSGDKTLTEDDSNNIISYIENLQQRIDKAIEYLEKHSGMISPFTGIRQSYAQEELGTDEVDEVLSILQCEEVKDNEK